MTLTRTTAPCKVILQHRLDLHIQDLAPIHLRLDQVLEHTFYAEWCTSCARSLSSLHHSIANFVTQSTTFFFCHRLALAVTRLHVNVELGPVSIWILFQQLVNFFCEHAFV